MRLINKQNVMTVELNVTPEAEQCCLITLYLFSYPSKLFSSHQVLLWRYFPGGNVSWSFLQLHL